MTTKEPTVAKHTYTGSPGYFAEIGGEEVELVPGQTYELTAAEAAALGDEFAPAKKADQKPDTGKEG